jgi:hypothetical protein
MKRSFERQDLAPIRVGWGPQKKTGVVEYLQAFDHAGLLANEPPGVDPGLPFI